MAVRYAPAHGVALAAGGALSRIAGGASEARVNSLHGQAIDAIAPGLAVVVSFKAMAVHLC